MSRRIWGITLTVLAAAVLLTIAYWHMGRNTATPPEEQRGTQLVETAPEQGDSGYADDAEEPAEDRSLAKAAAEAVPADDYQFLLVNHNNYVAVYELPENEIYLYSDIILDVLPEELRDEIREGKYLKNEEELYNFLENYTS